MSIAESATSRAQVQPKATEFDALCAEPMASSEPGAAANDMYVPAHRILSGKGGQWEADDVLRDKLCFTDDGTLKIAQGHAGDIDVLGYIERLSRNRIGFVEVEAQYSEIKALYQHVADKPKVEHEIKRTTERQEEVLRLIREGKDQTASDIHLYTDKENSTVRFRVHGVIADKFTTDRARGEDMINAIFNSMCDTSGGDRVPSSNQNARFREDYAKRCGLHVARVATGPTDDGTHMVIRLYTDAGDEIRTLEELGYLKEQVHLLETMMRRNAGVILFSGTTGAGKTTTLANILKLELRRREGKICIITAEDPPEQPIRVTVMVDGKPQRYQAHQKPVVAISPTEEHVTAAWVGAIEHMLRQDPDIMMSGEMRGLASVKATIRAAMTGHLTLSSIHTIDAPTIIERLLDIGVDLPTATDPGLFIGLVNQSLVSRVCPHCSIPFERIAGSLPAGLAQRVRTHCIPERVRIRGDGCKHCHYGVIGRTACAEVIMPSGGFMRTYRNDGKHAARKYWLEHMKGISKCDHMIRHINSGAVCPQLAEEAAIPLDQDLLEMAD
jgi:general secretion pathway protein E